MFITATWMPNKTGYHIQSVISVKHYIMLSIYNTTCIMFTVYQSLTLIRCMSVLVSHTKVNTCYDELMIRNFNDNSTQ